MKIRQVAAVAVAALLGGCASTHPHDPFERYNRVAFGFNEAVDAVALKPAAEAYRHLPDFMQTGVYNFFSNFEDVGTALNNFLQGKFGDGLSDVARVSLNSTLGFAGVLDIASEAGLRKHREDFGQTLGVWGMESGPYVVLPFLGASTLRDSLATPLNFKADPLYHVRPVRWRNTGTVLRAIDQRATLLEATSLLEDAALDRYQFVRDAYMQRRRSQVYDGNPPPAGLSEQP